MTTHTIPNRIVNVAVLRVQAIAKLNDPTNLPVTQRERVVIGILITRCMKRPEHPLLNIVQADLLDHELPKFTALVGWLAPYALVTEYPEAISQLALYLLGHTTQLVHSTIDWDAIRVAFPQL